MKADEGAVMRDKEKRIIEVEKKKNMNLENVIRKIGWYKQKKKKEDAAKFKTFVFFYGIGLLLMLSRIPWNNWFS